MKALRYENQKLAIANVDKPVTNGEALVRVTLSGICNTDLEIARGYAGFEGTLGHEFVGTVDAGPADWRGKRVVGEINFGCGTCPACRQGLRRHCPTRKVMGILNADGAFTKPASRLGPSRRPCAGRRARTASG